MSRIMRSLSTVKLRNKKVVPRKSGLSVIGEDVAAQFAPPTSTADRRKSMPNLSKQPLYSLPPLPAAAGGASPRSSVSWSSRGAFAKQRPSELEDDDEYDDPNEPFIPGTNTPRLPLNEYNGLVNLLSDMDALLGPADKTSDEEEEEEGENEESVGLCVGDSVRGSPPQGDSPLEGASK